MQVDFAKTWYHGSPEKLAILRVGSSITQTYNVARAFSHKPEFLSMSDKGSAIRHNGSRLGYIYVLEEPVTEADVEIHPASPDDPWFEWLIKRAMRVGLLEAVEPRQDELMSADEVAANRQRLEESKRSSIIISDERPNQENC